MAIGTHSYNFGRRGAQAAVYLGFHQIYSASSPLNISRVSNRLRPYQEHSLKQDRRRVGNWFGGETNRLIRHSTGAGGFNWKLISNYAFYLSIVSAIIPTVRICGRIFGLESGLPEYHK